MILSSNNNNTFLIYLYLLFPFSLIIDLINGYTQGVMGIHTPIGVVFRGGLTILLLYQLFHNRSYYVAQRYLILTSFVYFFSMSMWIISGGIEISNRLSLGTEIESYIKILFFYLVIFYLNRYRDLDHLRLVNKFAYLYGLIITLCIIFSMVTGLGNASYGESYGFGTKSYFKAGNDVGLALLYCFVLTTMNMCNEMKLKDIISFFTVYAALICIGSRVAMIGGSFWLILSLMYIIFFYRAKDIRVKSRRKVFISLVIPVICYIIYKVTVFLFSIFDEYTLSRLEVSSILDAREGLTDGAEVYIKSFNIINWLFGNGFSHLIAAVGEYLAGAGERQVEADFHEYLGSYGIIGFIVYTAPLFYFAFTSMKKYMDKPTFRVFCSMFVFFSFLAIAYTSGHCFKNTFVAPVYSIYILIMNYEKNIIGK